MRQRGTFVLHAVFLLPCIVISSFSVLPLAMCLVLFPWFNVMFIPLSGGYSV